jgi:hypothetical protein
MIYGLIDIKLGKSTFIVVVLLMSCLRLLSQEYTYSEEHVNVILRSFGYTEAQEDLLFLPRANSTLSPLSVSGQSFSQYMHYQGPKVLSIYDGSKMPVSPGEYPPIKYQVEIPEDCEELLLLFIQIPRSNRVALVALEDSLQHFPIGSMRIINMSKRDITFMMGKTRFDQSPGHVDIIIPKESNEQDISILMASPEDGEMKLFYSTTWSLRDGDRQTSFLYSVNDVMKYAKFPESKFFYEYQKRQFNSGNPSK